MRSVRCWPICKAFKWIRHWSESSRSLRLLRNTLHSQFNTLFQVHFSQHDASNRHNPIAHTPQSAQRRLRVRGSACADVAFVDAREFAFRKQRRSLISGSIVQTNRCNSSDPLQGFHMWLRNSSALLRMAHTARGSLVGDEVTTALTLALKGPLISDYFCHQSAWAQTRNTTSPATKYWL